MTRVVLRRATFAAALRQPRIFQLPLAPTLGARQLTSVAETSFWKSLVPKPLRSRAPAGADGKPKAQQGWNPATFFIIISLLIGSMSIQMIALKKDFATFTRQSDVRIGLLREVVEKLQRGEEVDVEKVLGTGDAEKELVWEEVLRAIEREEPAKTARKKHAEPSPETNPKIDHDSSAAPEPARAPVQSELAGKGFF